MTTHLTQVDYIATCFHRKKLTKVHDIPTYVILKRIKNELKTNAAKVPTDLGGGQHGHLGLVVTLAEYAAISGTPYDRPAHPGAVLPLGPTQWETTMLRETYRGNLRLHRETQMVEQALLQQLTEALPENYFKTYKTTIQTTSLPT